MARQPNPMLVQAALIGEALMGVGAYQEAWESQSFIARLWYTLKGVNPGGRKGAPTYEQLAKARSNTSEVSFSA